MPICAIFMASGIVADRGPDRRFADRLCGGSLATLRQRGARDSIPRTGSAVALRGGVRKRHDSTEVDLTTGLRSVPNSEARKRASARNRMPARCRRRRGACAMFLRKPGSRCRKPSGRRQKSRPTTRSGPTRPLVPRGIGKETVPPAPVARRERPGSKRTPNVDPPAVRWDRAWPRTSRHAARDPVEPPARASRSRGTVPQGTERTARIGTIKPGS